MFELWSKKIEDISEYYERLVDQYGNDSRACDYGRAESQQTKFEVITQVMPVQGKRVLDVGCGFGDFTDYLIDHYTDFFYEGVDITPRMIQEARRLRPDFSFQILDIMTQDPGSTYDLVTANGIFYLLGDDGEFYMHQLIKRLYELSSEAVAFNSLSAWADKQEPEEFYADPISTLEFCRTLSPWVVLRHDYMPHDFTIYIYREVNQK